MLKAFKILLILCVTISIGVFLYHTDFNLVRDALNKVGFRFGYFILITFMAYYFATLAWKQSFPKEIAQRISVIELFFVRHIGEMVSLLNPSNIIAGEATKIYMLDEKTDKATLTTSIVISRAAMFITIVTLIVPILFTAYFDLLRQLVKQIVFTDYLVVYLIALVAFVLLFRWGIKRLIKQQSKAPRLLKRMLVNLRTLYRTVKRFYREDKKRLIMVFVYTWIHWLFGAFEFYLILRFIGINITFVQGMLVDYGVMIFKSFGSFIPGQIGFEEYGNKYMLALIGTAGASIWVTVSILRRARQLIWILIGVFMYLMRNKVKQWFSVFPVKHH